MTSLTVVVENHSDRPELAAEYGLALWLEHDGAAFLYDAGAGGALLPNLAALGLDPARLTAAVFSHGHLDHIGGLPGLLRARAGAPLDVWLHRAAFASHLARRGEALVDIGPPLDQPAFEALGARFHFVTGLSEPWPGLRILADIPRRTAFEGPAPNLVAMIDGRVIDDPFDDDLALIVDTPGGPALITGCAHAGVINILLAAEGALGQTPSWLIGGTHLGPAPQGQRQAAAAELAARPALRVASGHCTMDAAKDLRQNLGQRYVDLLSGLRLEF